MKRTDGERLGPDGEHLGPETGDQQRPTRSPAAVALGAVQQLLGGDLTIMLGANAPPLTAGRWHVVQRWRAGEGHSEGHTYLVRADEHGVGCTVVQSGDGLGYRVSRGEWVGDAGLQDYHVGVLTLPDLWGSNA